MKNGNGEQLDGCLQVDLLTEDPSPVFKWIEDTVPKGFVVRKITDAPHLTIRQ
jgi:hypothetical protein